MFFHGQLTIFCGFSHVFPTKNTAAGVASAVPEPRLVRLLCGATRDAEPPWHRAGRGAQCGQRASEGGGAGGSFCALAEGGEILGIFWENKGNI